MTVIARREDFEQLVTEILFALDEWTDLPDGPSVDDAREAVMRELLAYDWRGAVVIDDAAVARAVDVVRANVDYPSPPWLVARVIAALSDALGEQSTFVAAEALELADRLANAASERADNGVQHLGDLADEYLESRYPKGGQST